MKLHLAGEPATMDFATRVYAALRTNLADWTILLSGELGAGKSTFARGFIKAAGHAGAVPSPTYTLIEPYNVPDGRIYHIDLYRIADEDELRYLGWNELDDGCRLVEWPERAPGLVAQADLELSLAYDGDGRTLVARGLSERGTALLQSLADSYSED
ncbi:MAG: tRNA (adenosine(37)-N6)-threonylcarbamoyltransferase complex ATPase subunit type 1 TsaE [Proteobacteria bacterium]|nr:tRNA (adenosine(37)-N6)-threonylcarbamoyltransferase complex ATPase subunit type 1 TsaE [Pseudomonadota bacterium]